MGRSAFMATRHRGLGRRGDVLDRGSAGLGDLEPATICHRERVRNDSFDRVARYYSWMETILVGETLQKCRVQFLENAIEAQEILLVGEGHGRFLSELARVNTKARICCVDSSGGMLEAAKQRLLGDHHPGRIDFVTRSILDFRTEKRLDFIATQFFLDCFEGEELDQVVARIAEMVRPGGQWLVCDFQVPRAGWRALRARVSLFLAYRFFRCATRLPARRLIPPQDLLRKNGMARVSRAEFNYQLLYAELWERRRS